ncbi:uncharacterized protein N7483_010270 [Penicillium malachiteum]|uniref:uncharacterized protein n=1 Tax=Penicillium malachiteum TaxID=1324776 RepID=UPI0025478D05|nr:uncharacterized protein N7483_010270 [Penicillium malachiteum]KAJ5713089.1 hypothetical protein N7483_010270 [Penicillium malachiteum]
MDASGFIESIGRLLYYPRMSLPLGKCIIEDGYATAIVHNIAEIGPSLTSDTIVVHIPHTETSKNDVYKVATNSCTKLISAAQTLHQCWQSDKTKSYKLFSLITKDSGLGDLCHAPLYGLVRALKMEIPNVFGGLFEDDQGRFP